MGYIGRHLNSSLLAQLSVGPIVRGPVSPLHYQM